MKVVFMCTPKSELLPSKITTHDLVLLD